MRAVGGSSSAKVMPRKKKNGQSPARQPHGPPEGGRPVGYPAPQRYDFHQSSAEKENILKTMQEMFSHLDPEVIHIVLSECDFKVENAMDSLLELSGAAEGVTPQPPPVSGFERTAAALLSPHHFSQPNPDGHPFGTAHCSSSLSSTNLLMEDLDLLIDRELETLAEQRDVKDETPGSISSSLPLFPLPPAPQQALPELLQSSMEAASKERFTTQTSLSGGQVEDWSGVSSPLNQLSTWGDEVLGTQKDVLDFTHLTTESYTDKSKPPLDLAASGRPSAFQVYKKQETSKTVPESTAPTYSDSLATGARSKASLLNSNPHGYGSSSWNLGAPEFCRQVQGSQRPTFITPVAQGPSCWLSPSRLASPWLNTGPICQSPLKPSAVLKSWALSAAPQAPALHSRLQLQGKVLVLLRGAPGSGKSTLARALLEHNPGGVVLSTDDYFNHGGRYRFDPMVLGEAHEWNHKRARESFERGINPIIIDNTNMQGWEMKPYVVQALKHGYKVLFKEPDTWWKSKPRELERRTAHNVPVETIRRMLNGYDRFVTVQSIMSSHMPEFKPALLQENCHSLPGSADTPCPDLVDRSRLNVECKSFHPQLYSSLPDVSSISGSEDAGMPDGASCESTESLDLQLLGKQTSRPDAFDAEDIYLGEVHSEQNPTKREGRIPDCIVESVMNEDHSDEVPVAFSESIAQRVKRERSQRSGFDQTEAADLVKDTNSSDKDTSTDEQAEEEMVGKGEEKRNSEMLDFVGDWPSEESLQQRPVKRGERHTATQGKKIGDDEKSKIVKSGPDITELRKLLDLIQTGVVTDQMSSSCSLSSSSGEELEKQDEGGKVEKVNKTEERQQNRSKPGLPDCVQDWKANESHNSSGCCEGVESENKANTNTERISDSSETGKELLEPTDVCSDQVGNKDADLKEIRRSQGAESNMKQVSEGPESSASELFVEAESFGSSQEKKQRQGRRSGKQCKLALTFSHNSSMNDSDCSNTAAENTDTKNISNSDAKAISSDLKPDLDLLCPSRPELPTAFASVETSCFCQTEPQDFALLWRLNRRHGPDGAVVSGHSGNVRVLEGNSSSFVPWLSSTASAVNSSSVTEVPYRVVHEKGTQLEEKELGVTQNRLESLRILSRHFKLVSFDTLEDLYDKCSQDLEWTTNLLLDSGERFFRDEDCDDIQPSSRAEALSEVSGTGECLEPVRECESKGEVTGAKEAAQELTHETERASNEGNKNADIPFGGGSVSVIDDEQSEPASDQEPVPHTEPSPPEAVELERSSDTDLLVTDADFEDGAWGGSVDILDFETETTDDIASMDEINRLLQAELEEMEREQSQRKAERQSQHLNIQTVELKLSTELALQLTELFGPVGVDPGTCSADDFAVLMDLNLAKLLHQKWKETIQERQRQAALSFQLLEEKQTHPGSSPMSKNGDMSLAGQPDSSSRIPFMDHWNVSRPHVSLRDIIKEEQVLQANMQKTRQSRVDLHRWDGATLLKEKQLYQLFPTIDKHFLQDIFRDHNYSLTQTELFLRSLLNEDEPVKMVVAPEAPRSDQHRAASKEREKKQKSLASAVPNYQDTDDPEYEDFRAEANLQRRRQLENFAKAAEAFRQGRKEVASFYAQQGHLHGQRMREANHRAAVQIFERVNSSLLPRNILDLHGLHVNEALEHLAQVLEEKTAECEQGLCQPQLSVITGRGNHSQGGVARIRPAVIDYLTNKHYRFSEPKPGLVLVSLK